MICLRHILIFQNLLIWQKNYSKQKIKIKNNDLVELARVRWSNLKEETEKMSKEEIKNKKPNEILGIVNKIIDFNKEIQKQQEGSGLKILTPNQMLNRLPISLAQLKQEIILKNLKMKLANYCILCTDQKNLQNNFIEV